MCVYVTQLYHRPPHGVIITAATTAKVFISSPLLSSTHRAQTQPFAAGKGRPGLTENAAARQRPEPQGTADE